MKIKLKWIALALVAALIAAGVVRALGARTAQKEALAQQQAAQKQQAQVVLAEQDVVLARTQTLDQVLPVAGALKAVNSAFVKAKVAGELRGLQVREGDFVKAGQTIARIDPTEPQARLRQAEQQAQAAKAQVDIAKRSFDNNQSLVAQGFISKTALDTSSASLASAEANYRAALAAVDVSSKTVQDTVLKAPISGQVAQRLVQEGERVALDARVVEIVDLGRLELEASLSAGDSLRVQSGQRAALRVEGASPVLAAKVVRINPSAVAGSRAVLAYLALDNASGLRQGLYAQGQIALGQRQALVLPLGAVRTDKPEPYVQLVQDGKVVHQKVKLGEQGEVAGQPMVEVSGVAEGAQVLQGTLGSLREGTLVARSTVGKGGQ